MDVWPSIQRTKNKKKPHAVAMSVVGEGISPERKTLQSEGGIYVADDHPSRTKPLQNKSKKKQVEGSSQM